MIILRLHNLVWHMKKILPTSQIQNIPDDLAWPIEMTGTVSLNTLFLTKSINKESHLSMLKQR